jgi:flagellar motility protein MotE (MotC chaperone)
MKNLASVLVLMLAINFLVVAGLTGWLFGTHHLDRQRVSAIKDILFPPPATQPAVEVATTQEATTQPSVRLEELLAKESGHSASEQVEFIQHTFDAQMVQLDRRQRELEDLKRQTDLAQDQLTRDRAALDAERQTLESQKQQQASLASDKGFQDSLLLYEQMPAKQVKSIFMTLDDATVTNYLRAMEPRTAAKIIKEFKTLDDTARIQRVLERMRQATSAPATPAPATPTASAAQ